MRAVFHLLAPDAPEGTLHSLPATQHTLLAVPSLAVDRALTELPPLEIAALAWPCPGSLLSRRTPNRQGNNIGTIFLRGSGRGSITWLPPLHLRYCFVLRWSEY